MTRQHIRIRLTAVLVMLGIGFPASLPAQEAALRDSLESALLRLVFSRQPELVVRRAATATAEARLRAAGPVAPPVLGAEIENIPDWVNLADAGQIRLVIEREFLTGSRRAADRAVEQAAWEAAALRLELAERSVGVDVRARLATWLGWREIAARLATEDAMLQNAEAGLQARFATGEARYVDVLRLRTERLRVRSDRAEAILTAQAGRRRLEGMITPNDSLAPALRVLLDTLAALPAPVADLVLPPAPDPDSLLTALGALRFGDLRVASARARAEETAASRSALLVGGIGVQRFGDPGGGFTVGPSLRAAITLPFTVGGSTRALNQAAELAVEEAQDQRTAGENQLRTALLTARDRYVVALEQDRVYRDAMLVGAREEREAAVGAYRAGELSLIELLDFERALSRAEIARIRVAIDVQVAYAQLILTAAGFRSPGITVFDSEAEND